MICTVTILIVKQNKIKFLYEVVVVMVVDLRNNRHTFPLLLEIVNL